MDVSPEAVYDRFIHDAKGSYCFGQNTLLLGVLRCLGFRAYSGAARVNLQHNDPTKVPYYRSLTHMLLFVQPDQDSNKTWMVDVGFGALGLVRPIPLLDHKESGVEVQGAFHGEVHRLMRGPHPNCSLGASVRLSYVTISLSVEQIFPRRTVMALISRRTTNGTWKFAMPTIMSNPAKYNGSVYTASQKRSFSSVTTPMHPLSSHRSRAPRSSNNRSSLSGISLITKMSAPTVRSLRYQGAKTYTA